MNAAPHYRAPSKARKTAAGAVRCHKGWADLSAAFPHFATKVGLACHKGWAGVPQRMGRDARCATKDGPACIRSRGSARRQRPISGAATSAEGGDGGGAAARREELLRGPTARQPSLCSTPPNLYDNVQAGGGGSAHVLCDDGRRLDATWRILCEILHLWGLAARDQVMMRRRCDRSKSRCSVGPLPF